VNSEDRASLQDKLVVAKCKVLLFLKCEKIQNKIADVAS